MPKSDFNVSLSDVVLGPSLYYVKPVCLVVLLLLFNVLIFPPAAVRWVWFYLCGVTHWSTWMETGKTPHLQPASSYCSLRTHWLTALMTLYLVILLKEDLLVLLDGYKQVLIPLSLLSQWFQCVDGEQGSCFQASVCPGHVVSNLYLSFQQMTVMWSCIKVAGLWLWPPAFYLCHCFSSFFSSHHLSAFQSLHYLPLAHMPALPLHFRTRCLHFLIFFSLCYFALRLTSLYLEHLLKPSFICSYISVSCLFITVIFPLFSSHLCRSLVSLTHYSNHLLFIFLLCYYSFSPGHNSSIPLTLPHL